ncbi:aspartic proteinase-like protein 2 [Tanacetum coccineum]
MGMLTALVTFLVFGKRSYGHPATTFGKKGMIEYLSGSEGQLSSAGSANVVFHVQHKFGGSKRSLSEFKVHDSDRHRRFLSAADLPIGGDGSPTSAALYFTKIQIGTPPKDYHVQISLALFNPEASSTAKMVTCDEDICTSTLGAPSSDCKVGIYCSYSVTYGDGSNTVGNFVRDTLQLDRVSGNLQTTFMNGSIAFGQVYYNSFLIKNVKV